MSKEIAFFFFLFRFKTGQAAYGDLLLHYGRDTLTDLSFQPTSIILVKLYMDSFGSVRRGL